MSQTHDGDVGSGGARPRRMKVPLPRWFTPFLTALAVLVGVSIPVFWTWQQMDEHQQRESQRRFELDVQAIGELVEERMRGYEMALRGVSSAFVGTGQMTWAQWDATLDQLRVHEMYPGISSVAWSRRVWADQRDEFLARHHADGQAGFRVFPAGPRERYQPIEYIGPLNDRTRAALGLDLLTQSPQRVAIQRAMDSGMATLSMPLADLYPISPENEVRMGVFMYFPVYRVGASLSTAEERFDAFVGMSSVAFRGQEIAESIFGPLLQLFVIGARDMDANLPLFDTRYVRPPSSTADWQPVFHASLDLPLYGRTWQLEITGTPDYEDGLISDSHNLVLFIGMGTAVLLAMLAGGFMYRRDRQRHADQLVAAQLREQAEQLMVANRYKSEFLANMSHELRTPLNSILILSDQLRQNASGNLNDKQTRHADIVYRAGNDLLQLINDVLDLAKIEAGRVQLSLEPLNLQDLLVDLDAAMRPLAESKRLHLHIPSALAPESGVPPRVYTDRVRLHQMLRNLLSNAIKFTDEGQVNLTISMGETGKDGSVLIRFAVHDTGIGIDPAKHEQVFEAFQQLDGSTQRRFGGTGLGLVITRQLAQALGGKVTLQSAPGQGSTFTLHLPMQVVPQLPQAELQDPVRAGQGPAVLIVEDDATFAGVIIDKAHKHGFASVHCVTGQQALELLRAEPFAAVVLDILLPDISGWQLFRRMRALPAHLHTPVHIISCLPHPGGVLAQEHGTHYLTKPIERDVLAQVFDSLKEVIQNNNSHGPALLLVEDVEAEREHYAQQLASLGFAVTACATAQEARQLWSQTSFAVLVVDMNLPDGDGFSLLDAMDAQRSLHGVRVVVNTGLDVTHEGLQRLHGYSAVVVRKQGADTTPLEQAVQGFLDNLGPVGQFVEEVVDQDTDLDAAAPAASTEPKASTVSLRGSRLLLVDDDVRNVYAMSALLDDFGLKIATASNGQEAIDHYLQDAPDLILMDMSMPVMDGYTATKLLKTEHGCTAPIIALTAHAMKGDREKCLDAGADDYLAKPVDRAALQAMLTYWLTVSRDGQS